MACKRENTGWQRDHLGGRIQSTDETQTPRNQSSIAGDREGTGSRLYRRGSFRKITGTVITHAALASNRSRSSELSRSGSGTIIIVDSSTQRSGKSGSNDRQRCVRRDVVTRNDARTRVHSRLPIIKRGARGADHARGRSTFTSEGDIIGGIVAESRARYATREARGSDFCVGNGRSNKIRTPDNFRLRVISLSCPVDAGLFLHLLHLSLTLHPAAYSPPHPLPPP